jgi:hypothetical protein
LLRAKGENQMPIKQNNRTHSKKIYLRRKILLFIFVLSMFPLFFVSKNVFVGLSQTVDKKKEVFKETYKNEPVEFVELKSNGKSSNSMKNLLRNQIG